MSVNRQITCRENGRAVWLDLPYGFRIAITQRMTYEQTADWDPRRWFDWQNYDEHWSVRVLWFWIGRRTK